MEIQENNSNGQEEIQVHVPTKEGLDVRDVHLDLGSLSQTSERDLHFAIIQTAVEDYLYFGVRGKTGCDVEEFFSAYHYLFVSKSFNKDTWLSKEAFEGQNPLGDDQLKLMCFDVNFDYSVLSKIIKKGVLLTLLRNGRQKVVDQHYEYIVRKINANRRNYARSVGKKIKSIKPTKEELLSQLVTPTEESLCRLYFGE